MQVTLGQAAKQLGVGKATLSRYIKQGKLSAQKQEDGSYRIDVSELDRIRGIMRPPWNRKRNRIQPLLKPGCYSVKLDCYVKHWRVVYLTAADNSCVLKTG